MDEEYYRSIDSARQQAVAELIDMVRQRYPTASFEVGPGVDDPEGTFITATVDIDDPDMVTDLTIDRELELQIERGMPVYVIPIRTPERVAALRRQFISTERPIVLSPQRPS